MLVGWHIYIEYNLQLPYDRSTVANTDRKPYAVQSSTRVQWSCCKGHVNALVQDSSNSIALAMELLQPCTKPPM